MNKVSIRLLLKDPFWNPHTLDAVSDEFWVLKYKLYGTTSHVSFSLWNLQINKLKPLPNDIASYDNVEDLTTDIMHSVNTWVQTVVETAYSKSL